MQHGQDMVEQVLDAQPQPVQVKLGRGRQVGAALGSVPAQPQALVSEPCGYTMDSAIHLIEVPYV